MEKFKYGEWLDRNKDDPVFGHLQPVRKRYETDPFFCQIVEMLYNAIATGQLSLMEARQAASFAATKYELENAPARFIVDCPKCSGTGFKRKG